MIMKKFRSGTLDFLIVQFAFGQLVLCYSYNMKSLIAKPGLYGVRGVSSSEVIEYHVNVRHFLVG